MKTLENKTTKIEIDAKPQTYADLLNVVCDTQPKQGWTTTIMRERIRLQTKLSESDGQITFEDADATALTILVKDMTWALKHADLVTFEDDVIKSFS